MLRASVIAMALAIGPSVAHAGDPVAIYPGATYQTEERPAIPARIHLVTVDLSLAELTARATEEAERGQTVSAWAQQNGVQIAINGDYFNALDFRPAGLAMGSGQTWTGSEDTADSGFFSFRKIVDGTDITISAPEEVVSNLPEGTRGVIGGRPLLVAGGVAQQTFDCDDAIALPCERAPRTAVAISADGRTMWLAVVDGWQSGSIGMTAPELADFLAGLGADRALLLDGGASSALYIANQGGLVSSPSDGAERPVANHFGIQHQDQPTGTITGTVFKNEFGGDVLLGATVRLDDGRQCVTGPDCDEKNGASLGPADFTFNVDPRFACVTGKKNGFITNTECRQVPSSDRVFASLVLVAGTDPPDAMPPADAMPLPADAPPSTADAGPDFSDAGGPDAGHSDNGPASGGCACAISDRDRAPGDRAAGFCAMLLAASLWRRRRRPCPKA